MCTELSAFFLILYPIEYNTSSPITTKKKKLIINKFKLNCERYVLLLFHVSTKIKAIYNTKVAMKDLQSRCSEK